MRVLGQGSKWTFSPPSQNPQMFAIYCTLQTFVHLNISFLISLLLLSILLFSIEHGALWASGI